MALVDTSVLIDFLRGVEGAVALMTRERAAEPLHASELTRLEVLSGMRPKEEAGTHSLLSTLIWHPVDRVIAERASGLARHWPPSHGAIDAVDYAIAATALGLSARLLTRNVRHFPMIAGLAAPY